MSLRIAPRRADHTRAQVRHDQPATRANAVRNARAELDRHRRWAPARVVHWSAIREWLPAGANVAIVGAGNGDDLPLAQLTEHGLTVTLIDVDRHALLNARRSVPRALRSQICLATHDVTGGAADRHVLRIAQGLPPTTSPTPLDPLPGGPYDVVIGDLFYSQLVYPALVDLGLTPHQASERSAPIAAITVRDVVERLHLSAGTVIHVHDPAAWWQGHPQPLALEEVLALADPEIVAVLDGPRTWDPRVALAALDIPIVDEHLWHWPFVEGVDYLVRATVAKTPAAWK